MTTGPENFRYHTPMAIRYRDMDTLGHVNNAVYLSYFEQARVGYFNDQQLWTGEPSVLGLIVARITVEYKQPLAMSDGIIDVWTRCSRLGTRSFTMEHIITRATDNAVAATGEIVVVVFDYVNNQTVPLPDAWRARLTEYEPGLT
ncbi:MAG: acyl-CoA thioesterase [Chloroflexota bacterium]